MQVSILHHKAVGLSSRGNASQAENLEPRQHNLEHSLQEWNDLRQQMAAVEKSDKKKAKRTQ